MATNMLKKIIVIDDEVEITRLLKIKLEREGYDVTLAHNGDAGLRLVKEMVPDLVLLDGIMPRKDGYEVLAELKNDPVTAGVPVIMLTARVFDGDIQMGLDLKADDYIVKPFHTELILKRIETVLKQI
jgi:DNA-binding response OmpR family regulator